MPTVMRVALYQPDIPQNTAAILRLAACLGISVDIVEPCGFVWSQARMRRTGMDYLAAATVLRHPDWRRFERSLAGDLVLLTTKASRSYLARNFKADDVLLLGREGGGAPPEVHDRADDRIAIPMQPGMRSLNIVTAAALVLGEGLRQTGGFPAVPEDADA